MQKIESLEGVAVTTVIAARPETVFGILTTPEGLSTWLGGTATFEATVGAPFQIVFQQFGTTVAGEVRELTESERLALTWGVAEGPQSEVMPEGSTLVTFDLTPEDGGTRVTVTHEDLPDPEVGGHKHGWRFHMNRLGLTANRAQLSAELPEVLSAYFQAWSTDNTEERTRLFETACTEDVGFMDEYATFTGREMLALHAGSTRQYFPGSRIEASEDPSICRGEVLVPFTVSDPDGKTLFTGTNYARVAPDGRLAHVTGFWASGT
ncbi:MAG: SRPBCC family protein [Longimicrobiales bacterium]